MVFVLVGNHDGIQLRSFEPDDFQPPIKVALAETAVDENVGAPRREITAVSRTAAAENGNGKRNGGVYLFFNR